jgi:hypothetical protein
VNLENSMLNPTNITSTSMIKSKNMFTSSIGKSKINPSTNQINQPN